MSKGTGRGLTVAESDSSGGAGMQADIKTILALGGHASTAITALTAQNSRGVVSFQTTDPAFVAEQMRAVLDDAGVDAIKTGILGNEAIINAVGEVIDDVRDRGYKLIIDPAIVTRSGEPLMDPKAIATLKRRLLFRADVITPNKSEAELLTGMVIKDIDDMKHAADMLRTLGIDAVVLKGGQLLDHRVLDFLAFDGHEEVVESEMVDSPHTHGAGDTLSSAIAVSMAQGMGISDSFRRALDFLDKAIRAAADHAGEGIGAVNHGYDIQKDMASAA